MTGAPPAALTLVVGPETLLADRAVRRVVSGARELDTTTEVHDLAAAGLERGVVTEAMSPSLFGGRAVVVVRDLHDASDAVAAELEATVPSVPEEVHLVLVHRGSARGRGLLDAARRAGALEVKCPEVKKRAERMGFLAGEFRAARRRVSEDALDAVLVSVGNDLRALASAADQLASDVEGAVDLEAVQRYYAGRAEVSGFVVADRAVEGRTGEALTQLRWALASGTEPVLVVSALATALRSMVKVAAAPRGLRGADLAREVGMPPWKVDVVRRQLPGWSPEAVAGALAAVAEADVAVKGGGTDAGYALERAVVRVARARG